MTTNMSSKEVKLSRREKIFWTTWLLGIGSACPMCVFTLVPAEHNAQLQPWLLLWLMFVIIDVSVMAWTGYKLRTDTSDLKP